MQPIVAIVGRPNVGKSTLFNRLASKRKAIVDDVSGVTRDRIYEFAEWNGREFLIVDTGGYVDQSDDIFEKEIKKQVNFAIQEASVILFVVDTQVGLTALDEAFNRFLISVNKPVLLVANKVDDSKSIHDTYEFYKLGYENIFPVSSINGSGTGDLLDEVVKLLPPEEVEDYGDVPRFCVVGKPNTGKSTFINALIGEERSIVSDIPGTTRDAIHTLYRKFNREFLLIDTAGLRKKSQIYSDIEYYSVVRAVRAIHESDVCFLMIDALESITSQDLQIIRLITQRKKGLVVLLNKWDKVENKTSKTEKLLIESIRERMAPFTDVPILTISALEKVRLMKAIDRGFEVFENLKRRIPTSKLNDVLLPEIEKYHPPAVRGKFIKIKYITQIKASYPLFAFYCNFPQYVKEPYKRFLENKIRQHFSFTGVPIFLSFRKK